MNAVPKARAQQKILDLRTGSGLYVVQERETMQANRQLPDLLRDAGLRAPSAHLGFGMQDTGKLLDDAKTLGVQYVVSSVLVPNGPPKSLQDPKGMQDFFKSVASMSADDFRRIAAKANEIGQKAKAAGLKYAYHNSLVSRRIHREVTTLEFYVAFGPVSGAAFRFRRGCSAESIAARRCCPEIPHPFCNL
jgi:hypothetical protein